MAVTVEKSTQLTAELAGNIGAINELGAKFRIKRFNFTQGAAAGDATSSAELVQLPAGRVRVYPKLSVLSNSAFGASRVLDVGYKAYTSEAGAAVTADLDFIDNDIDVSSAASAALGTDIAAADKTAYFASATGVTLVATVAGGTIPVAATLDGYVVYSID